MCVINFFLCVIILPNIALIFLSLRHNALLKPVSLLTKLLIDIKLYSSHLMPCAPEMPEEPVTNRAPTVPFPVFTY